MGHFVLLEAKYPESYFSKSPESFHDPLPLPFQPIPISMHTQHSLLRPLEFHPRLGRESLHHFLQLLGEGAYRAGRGCRHWDEEGRTLSFTGAGFPHKQLVVHDAKTGGKMGPQTGGRMDQPAPAMMILLPLPARNQIPSIPLLHLSSRLLDGCLCPSHRAHFGDCLPASLDGRFCIYPLQ